MADPKSAALPLGDAPMAPVRPQYRVGLGDKRKRAGASRPVYGRPGWLVRHRGADRVPHATDLLAHEGQRADHGDADEDQDEPVLGVSLARLATKREPIHHDHPLHSGAVWLADDGRNGPFGYGRIRPP